METFGNRLKSLRDKLKMSQQEFGETLGLSGAAIGLYETKDRMPKITVVNDIVSIHGVNQEWLLSGTGSMFLEKSEKQSAPVTSMLDAIIESNRNLNFMVSMLAARVRELGGELPPGLGKFNGNVLVAVGNKLGKLIQMNTNTDTYAPDEVQAA